MIVLRFVLVAALTIAIFAGLTTLVIVALDRVLAIAGCEDCLGATLSGLLSLAIGVVVGVVTAFFVGRSMSRWIYGR